MTSKRFWKLTLYEWSICIIQITANQNKDKANKEFAIELWRTYMCYWAASKDGKEHSPTEFARLSYDDNNAESDQEKISPEELQRKMEERSRKFDKKVNG